MNAAIKDAPETGQVSIVILIQSEDQRLAGGGSIFTKKVEKPPKVASATKTKNKMLLTVD